MNKALFVTMEFWPFKGGVARLYKNFCDEWGADLVVYTQLEVESQKVYKVKSQESSSIQPSQSFGGQAGSGGKVIPERTPHSAGEVEGYEVIRKPFFWKIFWPHWLKLLRDLAKHIRNRKPPVVFVGQILPVGTAVYLLSKIFDFEYVVFVHGLDVQWAARGNLFKRFLARKVLCSARCIVSNSEYTKWIAGRLFQVLGEKIVVVYPKAYKSENSQQGTGNREHPPIIPPFVKGGDGKDFIKDFIGQQRPNTFPVVLSVGRLVPRKGFDDLIVLAKEFKGKATVIIFGKGPDEERLRSLITEHDVDGTVYLLTKELSDDDMERLYRSCDVFVFLPKELEGGDVEGFGQVALEAQSFGKPVIVRESGGAGEALIPGETGFLWKDGSLVTLKSYLVTLLDSKELREQMGEKGKIHATKFASRFHQTVQDLKHSLTEQSKKVSIIIPVGYDVSRIIPTLKSIEGQTYRNIEVIVVGDGIPIEELPMSNYQLPITTLKIPKNGAAAARNAGLGRATGEYLLFVDDDTVLRKDCVDKMVGRFESYIMDHGTRISKENPPRPDKDRDTPPLEGIMEKSPLERGGARQSDGVCFVYSGFYFGWKAMPAVPFDRRLAYEYPYIDTTSMMRRGAFPGFDESLRRLQDWDLFLTIIDRGGKGEAINEYLYRKSARLFKNLLKWKGISFWFPKFVWKLPIVRQLYNRLPPVKKYSEAVRIVKEKHYDQSNKA